MTTITINERTKAGKIVLELAKILSVSSKGVTISEDGLKNNIASTEEKSPYDPKFVEKIKRAEKRANYTKIDPNDIWGSIMSK
jgi:hypothetical protein